MGDYSYCYGKNGRRKKNLDPTQAHMNHVHIELNLKGAAKRTTFWDKNVSYDTPDPNPVQQPTISQPTTPAQQPEETHPWTGNGQTGGGQYDNSGGTWGSWN